MKNRKTKSNRAQADYFELLVCQYICHLHNIRFAYSQNLAELSNQVLILPEGSLRLKLQNDNLLRIAPKIKEILDFEVKNKGKIIEVAWIGRKLTIKTTSDVDAEHLNKRFTRFSIKSIAQSGTGTIKNLGMRGIKEYLDIDFSNDYKQMWLELVNYAQGANLSQEQLKEKVLGNEKLFEWASLNGKKYQIKLNTLCFNSFNNLSIDRKVNLLNYILDANDNDLYVIIVNSKGIVIYNPIKKQINLIDEIEAKKDNSNVGYTIYINKTPTYRVQTNNTNGIGISAFCQRIFFSESQV